jgi:hypothetical protein
VDENFIKQAFAELIESTGIAVGYFAAAVARTGDATRLAHEMRAQLEAAKRVGGNPVAVRIATQTLAALDAEAMIQKMSPTKQ